MRRESPPRFTGGDRLTSLMGRIQAEAMEHSALPDARSGFFLGLQDLPALVHAGLQVEVMRAAQFAGILVLGISRLLQRVRRAAHATPRGRCFSTGNGHVEYPLGVLSEASSETGPLQRFGAGANADKAALIEDGMPQS